MSRIYDAMKKGATRGPSGRVLIATGPDETAAILDPVEESYQRILQAIQGRQGSTPPRTILVASAIRGEGASTVARALAALLSRDEMGKTVLVDANLRSPSQHRAFGVELGGGLTEVVTRGLPVQQAVRNGASAALPLVTSGRPAGNPAGVLSAPAFRTALEELRTRYSWVIVDGPPITVYSDVGIIAPLMDGVVLVIQAERTRWEVAEQAKRSLQDSGARVLGGVLSRRRYHIPQGLYGRL